MNVSRTSTPGFDDWSSWCTPHLMNRPIFEPRLAIVTVYVCTPYVVSL